MALLTIVNDFNIVPGDSASGDNYGDSVSVSADGLVMAVGAVLWEDTGSNTGGVYIYDYSGGSWSLRGSVLEATSQQASSNFGCGVSLSSDGAVLVVGADLFDITATNEGQVHTFDWNGSSWSERSTLSPDDSGARFGSDVAISSDGLTLAVGSDGVAATGFDKGAVYVYSWTGSAWSLDDTVTAPDEADSFFFGTSVDFNADADVLIVGAIENSSFGYGFLYTFDYTTSWTQRGTKITFATYKSFGIDCALSSDATIMAVGASGDDNENTNAGAIYIYDVSGSAWTERGYVHQGGSPGTNEYLGTGTELSAGGNKIYGGAPGISTNAGQLFGMSFPLIGNGAANLFTAAGTATSEVWIGNGAATLGFGASASGYVSEGFISYLNSDYSLSSGYIAKTSFLNNENELNVFIKYRSYLDNENILAAYVDSIAFLNSEYDLDAFRAFISTLDAEYGLPAFVLVKGFLSGEYDLDSFVKAYAKINAEYNLKSFILKQGYLNHENAIDVYKAVRSYLNLEFNLDSFIPKTAYLDHENTLNAHAIVTAYLNGDYSIDRYLERKGFLGGEYELGAFESIKAYLGAEYNLNALEAITAFLDAAYNLDATEVFYTFATNLESGAVTEYENYNFNSISGNMAATSTAIYALDGSTDDGTAISCSVESGKLGFGGDIADLLKRATDAYVSVSSNGNLKLTITTATGPDEYILTGTGSLEILKANLARGARGKYFQVKLENILGSTMDLDSMNLLIQILSRRV